VSRPPAVAADATRYGRYCGRATAVAAAAAAAAGAAMAAAGAAV